MDFSDTTEELDVVRAPAREADRAGEADRPGVAGRASGAGDRRGVALPPPPGGLRAPAAAPGADRSGVAPPPAGGPVGGLHATAAAFGTGPGVARERCAGCGSALASDQRYCVECGERLGAARLPFLDDLSRPAGGGVSTAGMGAHAGRSGGTPSKARLSVNSTLIAGVGTLLLAMGIGILIGRSSPDSSTTRNSPIELTGVPATGAATAGTAGTGTSETAGSTGAATASGGSSLSKAKAAAKPAKTKLPPPKVVTVGSPGKGPGYEKGHFTGNFFGKEEEGGEEGTEAEEGKEKGKGKKK